MFNTSLWKGLDMLRRLISSIGLAFALLAVISVMGVGVSAPAAADTLNVPSFDQVLSDVGPALASLNAWGDSFDYLYHGVGHPSKVDHPDVPNCTVLNPKPGCETVFPATIYQGRPADSR